MFDFINRKRELEALQDSFIGHVLRDRGSLSYLIQGRRGAGKTRLIHEFIAGIESDKRIASRIPKFRSKIHVIEYECKQELTGPYLAFVEISKQIQEQQQTVRILRQAGMLAISLLPIHDMIEDFLKLGNAINSGETEEAIRSKETRLFTKYLKTLKNRSRKVPLILYIKNVQWIDDHSLELLHALIDTEKSLWGMIILEQNEMGTVNPNVRAIFNKLIDDGKLFQLTLHSMQKGFETEMLECRFGPQLFTTTEYEHIYTISEGCPGILARYAEEWIRKEWLYPEDDHWCKIAGFENRIKAPQQKLLDLLITLLQDGVISAREHILINNFAEEWGIGADVVAQMTAMLLKAQEMGYIIERRVHSGAIGKDAFLAYDAKMNRYLVEYVNNIETIHQELVPHEVKHPHLLGTKEIKQFKDGVLIVNDYCEGKTLKELKNEAYDSHIKNTLKMAEQVAEGLAELHRNNLVHGHLRPEAIIVSREGDVRLTGLDADQLKMHVSHQDLSSLYYSSPEQINQEKIDARSDIFSFGVLLYELLTGELPFQGKNRGELKQAIRFEAIPPFDYIKSRIPLEIQNLISKCLHKNPQERFQNASHLLREIQELLFKARESEPHEQELTDNVGSGRHVAAQKKRLLVPALVSLFAIVAAVFATYLFFFSGKSREKVVETIIIGDFAVEGAGPSSRLTADMLKYLITDDLMQASDVVALDEEEFHYLYPGDNVPKLRVDGAIKFKGLGFNIVLDLIHQDGRVEQSTLSFVDPSALLTSEIAKVTAHILTLLDIAEKKKSTFTTSWDAFESFYEGEKAWDKLESTAAEQKFSQALDIDPDFVLAKLRLASVLQFKGSTSRAQQLVHSIHPHLGELSYVDSLKAEALTARLSGHLRREIDILRIIYNQFSTRKEAPYEVAEAYYTICDIKNAIDFYEKVLYLDENFGRAHNHLAYCYSHLGDHRKALIHFKKYVQLDSTANAYDSLGDGYMAAGALDSAAWAKERGIRLDPQVAYLYGSLCYIQIRQARLQNALSSIEKYLDHSPEMETKSAGYFRLALTEYTRKDYVEALDLAQEAIALFDSEDIVSRNHELHWLLGLLYLQTGHRDKAEEELSHMQALIDLHNISATNYRMGIYKYARHLQACLAAHDGDMNFLLDIIREFEGPIKDKIKDHGSPFDLAFFHTHFAELLQSAHIAHLERAKTQLESALAYNPNYAMARYQLWRLYENAGQIEKSRQELAHLQLLWDKADADVREL
ncbi:protein kinase, partial [candidate division KSB1 bacterium]|nr:protein kinase [candidate division KSB1 bacterium]